MRIFYLVLDYNILQISFRIIDPLSKDFIYSLNILTFKMTEDQLIFCCKKGSKPKMNYAFRLIIIIFLSSIIKKNSFKKRTVS